MMKLDLGGSTGSKWSIGLAILSILLALTIDTLQAFVGVKFSLDPSTLFATGAALLIGHQARRGLETRVNGTHKDS